VPLNVPVESCAKAGGGGLAANRMKRTDSMNLVMRIYSTAARPASVTSSVKEFQNDVV
jgi:hypothetical protein